MSSVLQVTCANCGAKYKLPESFQKPQAKCTKCGSVIDVAGQRAAAESGASAAKPAAAKPASAKPAAARPAAAKPAAARPARARGAAARKDDGGAAGEDRPARRGARGGGGGASARRGGGGGGRGRNRGGDDEAKSGSSTAVYAGAGVVVVALAVVAYVMFGMGGDEPKKTDTAKDAAQNGTSEAAQTKTAEPAQSDDPKAGDAMDPGAGDAAGAAEASAGAGNAKPAEASDDGDTAAAEPAEKPAEKKPTRKAGDPITSPDQVYDPSAELSPVQWPDDISAEEKEGAEGLVEDVKYGGYAAIQAKQTLAEEKSYVAVFAIVETLRTINYLNNEEAFFAYELNKILEQIFAGINVGYRPVQLAGDMDLEDANWNALCARTWHKFISTMNSRDAFEKAVEARKKKQK